MSSTIKSGNNIQMTIDGEKMHRKIRSLAIKYYITFDTFCLSIYHFLKDLHLWFFFYNVEITCISKLNLIRYALLTNSHLKVAGTCSRPLARKDIRYIPIRQNPGCISSLDTVRPAKLYCPRTHSPLWVLALIAPASQPKRA